MITPKEVLFWRKVNKNGPNGCWIWTAATFGNGYGAFGGGPGKLWKAHRYSWVLANGPIPEGKFVCHECDNPPCVNPDHLFLGTHEDNMKDCVLKNRSASGGKNCNSNASLLEREVMEIYLSNKSDRELADFYGTSTRTISRIRNSERWAWLTNSLEAVK